MYLSAINDHRATPRKETVKTEEDCERWLIEKCLRPNKIHWGVLEHPQLSFQLTGVPRFALIQLRTHRQCTFDIQSMRETGEFITDTYRAYETGQISKEVAVKEVFATEYMPVCMNDALLQQMQSYTEFMRYPHARYEKARFLVGDGVRANCMVSLNLRHLLHIGSVRLAGNAQFEVKEAVWMMLNEAEKVHPQIVRWFFETKPERLTLSP